jgi:hypothetical protein
MERVPRQAPDAPRESMDDSLVAQEMQSLLATLEALGYVERISHDDTIDYRLTAKGIAALIAPFRQQIDDEDDA